jgi:two-component system cell cycle response regulator
MSAVSPYRAQLADRRRRQLSDAVAELRLLPTTVSVPMKILRLQKDPAASIEDVSAALSADPSLTSKVLALANSASCAPARPVTKLSGAVARIGLKNLLSLVLGLSIGGIFNKMGMPAAESKGLWRAALLKATAARELAARLDPGEAEEAYVAGLLQDVGLPLVYATDPSAWPETAAILDLEPAPRRQRELAMYGTDHATLGRAVTLKLGLPPLFQAAVAIHHDEGEAFAAGAAAVGIPAVASAASFAGVLPHRLASYGASVAAKLAAKLKALDPQGAIDHAALLKSIADGYAGTLELLGESDESSAAVKEFLQALGGEVAGILEASLGESIAQISQLTARGAELEGKIAELKQHAQRTDYDPLTKALTPDAFAARAERFLALAREYQTPCAVGVADVAGLSKLNQVYNLVVADEALAAMATRLNDAMRGKGIIARIGPDDFALLMVSHNQRELAAEADRLETLLADLKIGDRPDAPPVPVRIGLVWLGVPGPEMTLEWVLLRANDVLKEAKAAAAATGQPTGRRVLARSA